MSKRYFYDLTVLYIRHVMVSPSGTDRVDFRYAKYLHDHHADETTFIKQHRGKICVVSNKEAAGLIRFLDAHWSVKGSEEDTQGIDFRAKYHGLWEAELDLFFSMPYQERYQFLINNPLTVNVGEEVEWVEKMPSPFIMVIYMIASSSKMLCSLLIRIGRFIGIIAKTRNLSLAVNTLKPRKRLTTLIDYLKNITADELYYIYTCYTRVHPIAELRKLSRHHRMQFIFFIHDFIGVSCPEYYGTGYRAEAIKACNGLLSLTPHIIANSNFTKTCLDEYCSERNKQYRTATVAHVGVEENFINPGPVGKQAINDNYFLIVATIEPRKNHLMLLNIWRDMVNLGMEHIPHLYIVGKRGWENENIVDMLNRCQQIQPYVHEVSDIKDEKLISLYKHARALLYPSFLEGWGMPIVEALTLGTPVVCSDIAAHRESGQGIPDYINPIDGKGWYDTILDYTKDESELRSRQLERLAQFEPPTWQQHFEIVERRLFSPENAEANKMHQN